MKRYRHVVWVSSARRILKNCSDLYTHPTWVPFVTCAMSKQYSSFNHVRCCIYSYKLTASNGVRDGGNVLMGTNYGGGFFSTWLRQSPESWRKIIKNFESNLTCFFQIEYLSNISPQVHPFIENYYTEQLHVLTTKVMNVILILSCNLLYMYSYVTHKNYCKWHLLLA
jgi:hypothetical protein